RRVAGDAAPVHAHTLVPRAGERLLAHIPDDSPLGGSAELLISCRRPPRTRGGWRRQAHVAAPRHAMAAPPEAPSARGRAEGDRLALPGHDLRQVAQWRSGDELARGPTVRLESCQSRLLLWRTRAEVRKVLPLTYLPIRLRVGIGR